MPRLRRYDEPLPPAITPLSCDTPIEPPPPAASRLFFAAAARRFHCRMMPPSDA